MTGALRIYNLFPSLVGSVAEWQAMLPRIRAMDFDWIFLNPIHEPGISGSLYSIRDVTGLNSLFKGSETRADDDILREFVEAAHEHGLKIMLDLVINHVAKDSVLRDTHPDWFRRDPDGHVVSPGAVNPSDPTDVQVWTDLAQLDYDAAESRQALVAYWGDYLTRMVTLGVDGFRCDAAYQVSGDVWRAVISGARKAAPGPILFAAETLGCTQEQVEALDGAGFDYLYNSFKWWDLRADWALDQYEANRRIAPSIAFPESHDTDRVAATVDVSNKALVERVLKFRYLTAACFSAGVMMPVGYEFGFRKPLHVVTTRPEDWETTGVDISDFVAAVNSLKKTLPALGEEELQRRLLEREGPAVALFRAAADPQAAGAIILINPSADTTATVDPGQIIRAAGGRFARLSDVTPSATPASFLPGQPLLLEPMECRVIEAVPAADLPVLLRALENDSDSLERLETLAASRVAIESVTPEIDGGRFPIKRVAGDVVTVEADIFCDGHDKIAASLKFMAADDDWQEAPMVFVDNDRWAGEFPVMRNSRYHYTIEAWRDLYESWCVEITKKRAAGLDVALELTEGKTLVGAARDRADARDGMVLDGALARAGASDDQDSAISALTTDEVAGSMRRAAERNGLTRYHRTLEITVDRTAAAFAAWYEIFPRSQSGDPERHGTFDDVIARLPYVRDLGFDVLYFPPIHPIGMSHRKGKNNTLNAQPGDPGVPYAIGSDEGGHTAIHAELGTFEDFRRLVRAARDHGLEIALDFAIQCSPDHPWIKDNPDWFDWRPDGTIKYAENPPKKYEDIVNVHFYRKAKPAIWVELRNVVLFWIKEGVRIFRVDNPHTKPYPFWEWLIADVQARHPDAIFLSEAFTRPKVMKRLAKIGFTQSYTYFTWRNTKAELTDYLTELTRTDCADYMRPNFFTNTPDINPYMMWDAHPGVFKMRAALAATLSPLWGLYNGFELCESTPLPPKEEYLNSEKYEIRAWDWDRPGNIKDFIRALNRIRRDYPAFGALTSLAFYPAHDDNILWYGRMAADRRSMVLIAVNVDPKAAHGGTVEIPMWEFDLDDGASVAVENLLTGDGWTWQGRDQWLHLDPQTNPVEIFRITPA